MRHILKKNLCKRANSDAIGQPYTMRPRLMQMKITLVSIIQLEPVFDIVKQYLYSHLLMMYLI